MGPISLNICHVTLILLSVEVNDISRMASIICRSRVRLSRQLT